jgi:hypothetical protein
VSESDTRDDVIKNNEFLRAINIFMHE